MIMSLVSCQMIVSYLSLKVLFIRNSFWLKLFSGKSFSAEPVFQLKYLGFVSIKAVSESTKHIKLAQMDIH